MMQVCELCGKDFNGDPPALEVDILCEDCQKFYDAVDPEDVTFEVEDLDIVEQADPDHEEVLSEPPSFKSYQVVVQAPCLNVRRGPSSSYEVVRTLKKNEICTIFEFSEGFGRIAMSSEWIDLAYVNPK